MTQLFNKIWRVTVTRETLSQGVGAFSTAQLPNQTVIEQNRVRFKIERSLSKHPDVCDVTIDNLSDSTRTDIERKPLRVDIEAGYKDTGLRLLFAGDLRFAMTELKGVNYETLLQLGDGDRAFAQARIGQSYRQGATKREVLKDAAATLGLALPPALANDPTLDQAFGAGFVAHGKTRDVLTRLLAPHGYAWTMQSGGIVILKDGQTTPGGAVPINLSKGMLGTPQFGSPPRSGKPPHIKVDMLLYPELCPGQAIDLDSEFRKGLFRIEKVRHEGDTHSPTWKTEIEIKPLVEEEPSTVKIAVSPSGKQTLQQDADGLLHSLSLTGQAESFVKSTLVKAVTGSE